MGQEIVYCFKCQKRILGGDYAKGLAYQLENNSCCSGCAVQVLDTLPPKAKEQLLGKMFKATHEHQSGSAPSPSTGTRRIPVHATPPPLSVPRSRPSSTSPMPLVLTLGAVGAVVLMLLLVLPSGRTSPAEGPTSDSVKRPPPALPAPDPGPPPEEKRRTESAKEALAKVREYALANPRDFEGQAQRWGVALLEAERTGYELEAKRELEKCKAAAKQAAVQELHDFEREVRTLLERMEFKAVMDVLSRRRSRPGMAEWAASVESLERAVQDAAERLFGELKEKALAARDRGAPQDVAAYRAQIARWGLPDYVAKFDAALERPWRPLFDGRTFKGLSPGIQNAWRIQDGMLVHDNAVDNAAMLPAFLGDGDIRFRFDAVGIDRIHFRFRIEGANSCFIEIRPRDVEPGMDHELILSSRGETSTATLDGKAIPIDIRGKPRDGMIQFNAFQGVFRLKSLEYRPAP